jgi:glycosyltransferase involved in cell wall biosynthesis
MPEKAPVHWCFITPEYPPTVGGVADYTRLVATHLVQAGQQVTVLAPSRGEPPRDEGLAVEPVLGKFGPIGFWRGSQVLDSLPRTRRLFLQWVPHGFGFKSINLLVVLWIWWRVVIRRDQLWIMVHEPFLRFENSLRQWIAALIHRLMVWILLRCAEKVFAGNKFWISLLTFWAPRKQVIQWLPVPSNVCENVSNEEESVIRAQLGNNKFLIGNFGTYGKNTTKLLESFFYKILIKDGKYGVVCIGKNSDVFVSSFIQLYPALAKRIFSTGSLNGNDLSKHIKSCDLFVQLNQEGVSTRNGTLMAILSHGKTGVGNKGIVTCAELQEWNSWQCFWIVETDKVEEVVIKISDDQRLIRNFETRAKKVYNDQFSIESLVKKILELNNK